ncbi:MAG TPA: glucoamylase family protein [Terriglobia bacterium]|nr:glucoamylase family protein [Terriglobia bacterium]
MLPAENKRLMSAAGHEASHWNPAAPSRSQRRCLMDRWRRARASTQKAERWIEKLAAHGWGLPHEAQVIADNSLPLWTAFRETRQTAASDDLRKLPWVEGGKQEIIPRVYSVARSFLEAAAFNFSEQELLVYLTALQAKQPLDITEIWLLKPMLQLVLLDRIAAAADSFCRGTKRKTQTLSLRAETLQSNSTSPGLNGPPTTRDDEDLDVLTGSLQAIGHANWQEIFEKASKAEKILRAEPAGVYARMEVETRDQYRKAVVHLAARSGKPETDVAALAVKLASEAETISGEDPRVFERRKHAGYYLIAEGRNDLEARIGYRPPFHEEIERALLRWPEIFYIVSIEVVTVSIIAFLLSGLERALPPLMAIVLLLLPATEAAVRIVNQLVTFLLKPRRLPKMDFSTGIPPDCTTMVVVPTLLLTAAQVEEAATNLEVRYLANPDENLHFALLTDSPDSARPLDEKDELVELCAKRIRELNQKYSSRPSGSFFLFHRHRLFNPVEGAWMGWERKRGKLLDLNRLLRNDSDNFPVKVGDLSLLPNVRYVITLDSDTSLPREAARRLAGTLAHPLNKAVIDPATNTVATGYGILQPRVGISVSSATSSRLANILSGQTGFDPYTRAISDVYQDLFGEGSFTGKGVYEVDAYQRVLAQRFPCNALLSHDLIEGSYARAGLVSDIEVIDDYPSHFSAYSRRKHRWVRGDWQILRWLFSRVPGFSGEDVPNPIALISRWKILDNLRRSLIEAATLALLIGGWFFLPGGAVYWTVATLVLLLLPSYFQVLLHLLSAGGSENWPGVLKEALRNFVTEQVAVLFTLVFLFHQALMTLDAIFRTLIRLALTHKKLLEWETAAQAELKTKKRTPVEVCLDLTPWLSIALCAALVHFRPHSLPAAIPFLAVWAFSKPIADWVNRGAPTARTAVSPRDEGLLRESALRTWRFFREWSRAGINFLIPDNLQESPELAANVISPTNLGFLLTARLAAYDLGYLTVGEFARETAQTLNTALRMPKFKGHFFNWTHTETLKPLEPLFISTVDSGNLAACLWTLKQGCLDALEQPVLRSALCRGLREHIILLKNLGRTESIPRSMAAAIDDLQKRFASLGDEPSAWIAHFPELEKKAAELEGLLAEAHGLTKQGEMIWWAAELRVRITQFRETVEKFTPWLLPEYKPLFLHPNTLPPSAAGKVALKLLPEVMADIKRRLENENPALDLRTRSDLRAFLGVLQSSARSAAELLDSLRGLAGLSGALVDGMDFTFLYHPVRKLLSVGYNVTAQRREESCYDLLASESRTASFIAIAQGGIRQEAWFHLGRSNITCQGQRVLISWTGTMFEYLMPALWMKAYPDTVLGHSQLAAVRCQQRFGEKRRRPWGVSEAGWSKTDAAGHYQYRAFGIPDLALSPGIPSNVVAPYASFLALEVDPAAATRNLKRMKRMGWLGMYGFYESADYRTELRGKRPNYELVRSWMAHHQGMTLLALSNLLASGSIQKRFQTEPQFRATELILHERLSGIASTMPHPALPPAIEPPKRAQAAIAAG